MSAALRIVEALNRGDGLDDRCVPFVAALLKPIFNPHPRRAHIIHASRTK